MIKVFTDGAARGNPGPGGYGTIVVAHDMVTELGGREAHTTNNRMELSAVITGLSYLEDNASEPVTVLTDSSYVLNGAEKWIYGWQKNGWKTKTKDDVLNRDLWERLSELLPEFTIKWILLKGHAGIPANERCDVIATSFADQKSIELYHGELGEYSIDVETIKQAVATSKKSKIQKGSAYSYVSCVNGTVFIDKSWADCEARVKGAKGARFKKVFSESEERALIEEWGR